MTIFSQNVFVYKDYPAPSSILILMSGFLPGQKYENELLDNISWTISSLKRIRINSERH